MRVTYKLSNERKIIVSSKRNASCLQSLHEIDYSNGVYHELMMCNHNVVSS